MNSILKDNYEDSAFILDKIQHNHERIKSTQIDTHAQVFGIHSLVWHHYRKWKLPFYTIDLLSVDGYNPVYWIFEFQYCSIVIESLT